QARRGCTVHRRRRSNRSRRRAADPLIANPRILPAQIASRRKRRDSSLIRQPLRGSAVISNWLSTALARRNIHYGWVMVAVTFFTALITAGTVGAPGVFIVPLQREFGWSAAEISSAL